MYYCLSFIPQLSPELFAAITDIRKTYDPTAFFIPPHITLVFPTPDSIGEQALISHIQEVLKDWRPFNIKFGGLRRNRDHWLFLMVQEGEDEIKKLYGVLHTGILDDGRDVSKFLPHLGLGLFIKEGHPYDWRNPREEDFDQARYDKALRQAQNLPLAESVTVDKLVMTKISDEVIGWTRGERLFLPEDADDLVVREFELGHGSA